MTNTRVEIFRSNNKIGKFISNRPTCARLFILDCVCWIHCISVKTGMISSQPNKAVERGVVQASSTRSRHVKLA